MSYKKANIIYDLEHILLKLPEGFICPSAQQYIWNIIRKIKKEKKL